VGAPSVCQLGRESCRYPGMGAHGGTPHVCVSWAGRAVVTLGWGATEARSTCVLVGPGDLSLPWDGAPTEGRPYTL
jgi:hypothetical protein